MPYTFLDFSYEVLLHSEIPLTYPNIWQVGADKGLDKKLQTKGKTPWQTVAALLYVDTRDNENSRFIKVGNRPAMFFLKERAHELNQEKCEPIEKKEPTSPYKYTEKDLHPLLNYYTASNPLFNRAKFLYTKTISHEKSTKNGYNQWVYPDMVGFYMPIDDWDHDVIELNRISDNNSLQLFSFELKKSLNKSNYREAFFQAVSNSSWAHEGYLVTAEIDEKDDELLAELKRLAASFGIGIIKLELADIDSSYVLYPAKLREALDWETLNKLCEQNKNFKKFIQDVKIDFGSKIHKSEYDQVKEDIIQYIQDVLKVSPAE